MDPQYSTGGLTMPPLPPQPLQKPLGGNPRYGIKYRAYTEEDMRKAAHAILEEGMSLRKASVTFNVPKTTLAERMGDKRPKLAPTRNSSAAAAAAAAAANSGSNGNAGGGGGGGSSSGSAKPPATRYTWTEKDMEQAIAAVQAGESVREAARRFGVPPSNLNSRTRGREPKDLKGEVSRLTLKQESLLAEWASAQAQLGFPPTKDEVYDLAERVMRKSSAGDNGGGGGSGKKLGKQWIGHWMRRWPNVEVLDWKAKLPGGPEARRAERRVPSLFDTAHFAVIDDGEQLRQAPAG